MSGLISIAVTGINAAQAGLLTTSNNIANLNTEGYTRQRTVQASNPTVMTGAGGFGQGSHVVTVERMYSQALTKQVLNAQASVSALDTYYGQVSQIDNMLGDTTSGLSTAVQGFFDGLQAVAASPSSTSARQSMVTSAESMVSSFQSIYSRLGEIEDGVNSQISSTVKSINSYTGQIAYLNQKIVSSTSLGNQPVNDLLDKRDQLVSDLNKLVNVQTSMNDDGSYNVFVGTGQQLVVGSKATQMAAVASASDPSRIVVGLVGESGNTQELPERLITGGELGGLLSFRSEALDGAFNQLGLMAASVAQTFNAQNALGQDLLGNVDGSASFVADFFTLGSPVAIAKASNNNNSPSTGATVSVTLDPASYDTTTQNFYTKLTGSDYKLSYSLAGGAIPIYTLTRLSDNTSWSDISLSSLSTLADQGFTLSDDGGSYVAGDSFLIQPTRDMARQFAVNGSVAADPRLVAAAVPVVGTASSGNTGGAKVSGVRVSPGYSLGGLTASSGTTLTYSGGYLTGFPTGTVTVTIGNSSSTYSVPIDAVPYTSGATITINGDAASPSGISLTLSGTPVDGDGFTLFANTNGAEDGGNIVLLGKLQTQNTMLGDATKGTATYLDSYASFVNDMGNKTQSVKISSEAQTTLLGQATAARDAVSGVNKDEEAANLIQYQQAYQASAKILEVASKLFDTLISLG